MHQLLTREHRLRGYDEDVGVYNRHKHGNASWLKDSLATLEDPKAKFDWARFEEEYPPTDNAPANGERLDTGDVEQMLDDALTSIHTQ